MRIACCLALIFAATGPAWSEGEAAGDFDYYVLSLSWSPNWCELEGKSQGSEQCDPDRDLGWILHGLWPQYEDGWPSYCLTSARDPSRADTRAMSDIMGTSGLAWYEWQKHGRCSGLSSDDYFATARKAYDSVERPDILRKLDRDVTLPAELIEEAFLQSDPRLEPDMITVTCKAGAIQEARICLTKDLQLRKCGADVRRDCTMQDALFHAID